MVFNHYRVHSLSQLHYSVTVVLAILEKGFIGDYRFDSTIIMQWSNYF